MNSPNISPDYGTILTRSYTNNLNDAGMELKIKGKAALKKEGEVLNEKIEQIGKKIAALETAPFIGTSKDKKNLLSARKVERKKLEEEKAKLQVLVRDVNGYETKLATLTDSVAIRNLVEDAAMKLGQVKFKKGKFLFFKYSTSEKKYKDGALSAEIKIYDLTIRNQAIELGQYIEDKKKKYNPKTSPVLEREIKSLDELKKAFFDPTKGQKAAKEADRTLVELKILQTQGKKVFDHFRDEGENLLPLGTTSPIYIEEKAKALEIEYKEKYIKLEKKYEGKLHIPQMPRRFADEAEELKKEFSNQIGKILKEKRLMVLLNKKAVERLKMEGTVLQGMQEAAAKREEFIINQYMDQSSDYSLKQLKLREIKSLAQQAEVILKDYKKAIAGKDVATAIKKIQELQKLIRYNESDFPALDAFLKKFTAAKKQEMAGSSLVTTRLLKQATIQIEIAEALSKSITVELKKLAKLDSDRTKKHADELKVLRSAQELKTTPYDLEVIGKMAPKALSEWEKKEEVRLFQERNKLAIALRNVGVKS